MFNNEFPPLGGGTGTVNLELLKKLSKNKDINIDLITSSRSKKKEIELFSSNIRIIKYPVNNKNIHHSSNIELIKYTIKSVLGGLYYSKQKKYDLCFAWSTVPAGFSAFVIRIFRKTPFLVRIGGPDIPGFEERYSFIYKIISPIIKIIWKKSSLLITKCKLEKDMVLQINKKLPINTIFNGIDTVKFYPSEHKVNNSSNIRIICVARLIKRKGQEILLRAISNLAKQDINYEVDLVGTGDDFDNLQKQTKELNIENKVLFSSYITRNKIIERYHKADIFVLPSYNEGMSNALLEAMACGLPVVVTDVGGTPELVKNGKNGYIFEKGNVNELQKILYEIYHNKNKLNDMGNESRQIAENNSWEAISEIYTNLFKSYI